MNATTFHRPRARSLATTAAIIIAAVVLTGADNARAVLGDGNFVEASTSPEAVSSGVSGVLSSDFDHDGSLDLAVTTFDDVNILLGDGSGDFSQAPTSPELTSGSDSRGIALGRFNADAHDDLAIANNDTDNVAILLGDGTGNFTEPVTSPEATGQSGPMDLVTGRFNADAHDDIAVVHLGDPAAVILLGDGTGNFEEPRSSPETTVLQPFDMDSADLNADGFDDLVVPGDTVPPGAPPGGAVTILLASNTGDFTEPSTSPETVSDAHAVTIGDFNGDGFPDIAVSGELGGLTILLGDGTGDFAPATAPTDATGVDAEKLTTGHFNDDDHLDIATANGFSPPGASILLGDGDGGFTQPSTSPEPAGTRPWAITAGQFDGEQRDDLAVGNLVAPPGYVTILLNKPAGLLVAPPVPSTPPPLVPVTPPVTSAPDTILHSVFDKIRDRTPTFVFSSTDVEAVFECSVGGADFTACASPFTTSPLERGATHTFVVRAVDDSGNTDPTPAQDDFKVKKRKQQRRR